ncbi:MAG: nicotinate-nucleotide adenylyltransferase [Synechocystis sp.]|nr:nicotinate-nucleotide adenylyltransferase [Synechocystis sp.]
MKIALFGTSADPPTTAHRTILLWLAKHFDRVAVWASDNPFKNQPSGNGHGANLHHRQTMLKLLVQELQPSYPTIQIWEDLSDRRSLISLQRAKDRWGSDPEYGLVIGSDLIEQIPRWYEVKQLLSQVTLVIFARPGYPLIPTHLSLIENLGGHYRLVTEDRLIELDQIPQLPPLTPPVSSTDFRQRKDQTIIPDVVQRYINQHHLYGQNSQVD